MGRKNSPAYMKWLVLALLGTMTATIVMHAFPVVAGDLPLAAGSPLAGFNFDDRPLLLPIQRNFQMAMLTAGSELGRSCGKMEAYGWRMNQAEQQRVNQIFNNTVDRLRGLGYSIEAEAPVSISHDITLFTADRLDRHFLFMWSAGEIGLVLTLCETAAPSPPRPMVNIWPSADGLSKDVVQSNLDVPHPSTLRLQNPTNFTPIGNWTGDYICAQGYTGATLSITQLKGENFQGTFHFYPTAKNPYVPEGRYAVYGQYDRDSQRILINPGKWIQRPKNFYDTVMVGGFDPSRGTFSAYFQGINGCTSFEAKYQANSSEVLKKAVTKKKHKKKVVHKTTASKPAVTTSAPATPPTNLAPTAANASAKPVDVPVAPAPVPSLTPAVVPPATSPAAAPVTAAPEPAPSAVPAVPTPPAPTPAAQPAAPTTPPASPVSALVVPSAVPAATEPPTSITLPAAGVGK